jgi:putative resolvase
MPYVRPKVARQILGVTDDTLRSWSQEGLINIIIGKAGHRLYDVETFLASREKQKPVAQTPKFTKRKYIYCRVSTFKQKSDLDHQIYCLQQKYPDHTVVKDIASGINFKRKGFQRILEETINGLVEEIVVAHKDRLCRFAWEHFEWLFNRYGVRLVVDSEDDHKHSPEEELAMDLFDIIHVFSSRHYGQRRKCFKTGTSKDLPETAQEEKDQE